MLVAHATWHGGALCLWAEHDGPRAGRGSVHPFATADFAGTSYAGLVRGSARVVLDLILPSTPDHPLPSAELGPEPFEGEPGLAVWRVPALVLDPFPTMALLRSAEQQADVVPGTDLRYLALLSAEVTDLVRRGRVLPALTREDGDLVARWRPVPDPARFRTLAQAMPPACRAVAPGRPAAAVLSEALNGLTDTTVRGSAPHPLLPERKGKVPERLPLAERWFEALTGPNPVIPREPHDSADDLEAELDAWYRAALPATGPLRLAFRLTEPPLPTPSAQAAPPAGLPDGARRTSAGAVPAPEADPEPSPFAGLGDGAGTLWQLGGEAALGLWDGAEDDEPPWRVEFLLQAVDDPSLLVSAADVWSGEALLEGAEETLLSGLGRALRVFPDLSKALDSAVPSGLPLDTAGAFRFLRQSAPLLAAAGFGVFLPSWAGKAKLGLKLKTEEDEQNDDGAATSSGFGLNSLIDFRWELAVGEETIEEDELAELARLKTPLVRLRGQWVELDDDQLEAALTFLRHGRAGTMTAGQIVRAVIHAGEQSLPLVAVEAKGSLGDLLSGEADRRIVPMPTPAGIEATLRPYQERGLAWLAFMDGLGLGSLLADDMGLGKTLTLLAHLVQVRAPKPEERRPTLVVVPMSLVGNWQREAAKFAPKLGIYVHHGTKRFKENELLKAALGADLVLTTYGTASRDADQLAQVPWARVVCDEAQALKNSSTRQAKAVRSIPADSRIALTGTPVENHLTELWSLMEFANPSLLGPKKAFRERFAVPIESEGDEQAALELKRATQPFILRRLKTDRTIITDLPEKQEMKEFCNLTVEQASLYQATVEDMLDQIAEADDKKRRGLVLATMAKLKQVCNHPAHFLKDGSRLPGRSGKLTRLEEICGEVMEAGEKMLVFTQYAEFGSMLQPYLAARLERPVLWLHGGTSKQHRDDLVERFQSDTEPSVFLLSLKAAGTGLTLTAANHVVHVDRWWNPAVEDQATDRAFRIGQKKNVQVRKFICAGTLEERVDEMIERKKSLAESIVGTGEDWLTELSVAELRDVLRLSPEAVTG